MQTTLFENESVNIPKEIIQKVKEGTCVLFLGAMASAKSPENSKYKYEKGPPSGPELSRRLAKDCDYELIMKEQYSQTKNDNINDIILEKHNNNAKANIEDLQKVSLFYEFREHGSRKELVEFISKAVDNDDIEPSPALKMLASLPFRLIITTNYDHLFEKALRVAKTMDGKLKEPMIDIYDPDPESIPKKLPLDPRENRPNLLKLHGDIDEPNSIVITEEDYIHFIQRMTTGGDFHPIHNNIRTRLSNWSILFIGYGLKDYNLRLLFRTLWWRTKAADFPLSFSVDPYPDNLIVSVWKRSNKQMISFIKEDLWDFVPALYRAIKGEDYYNEW